MADNTLAPGSSPLPPKLDLRRSGIVKPVQPAGSAAAATPIPGSRPVMTPVPAVSSATPAPTTTPTAAPVRPVMSPAAATGPATSAPTTTPTAAPVRPVMSPAAATGPARPATATSPAPQPGAQPAWRAKTVVSGARPAGAPGAPRPVMGSRPATPLSTPAAGSPAVAAAAPVATPTPIVVGPPVSKKETSRIPLTAAKPRQERTEAADAGELSVTAPAPTPAAVRVMKLGETSPIAAIPKPSEVVSAEKRKTSRISLEAVMGAEQTESAGDGSTKTIRLKRPGDAPTIKVTAAPRAESDDAGSSTTQRKTVVIKRNTDAAGARKLSVARPAASETPGAAPMGGNMPAFLIPAPQPHWAFGVIGIAATLVACVVIYLFCSQAFGPNSSRTLYSYWPSGPNLMWPGKVTGQY